jgi:hypothetical protein
MIAAYTPLPTKLPILSVPEYRVALAFYWYDEARRPHNFLALYYWIDRCENDGSDY